MPTSKRSCDGKISYVFVVRVHNLKKTGARPRTNSNDMNMKLSTLAPRRAVNSGARRSRRERPQVTCFALRHILIPNGDGESAHLNFTFEDKEFAVIELGEGSYEIGREAETAEICLPIPTVSGRVRVETRFPLA